MPAVPLRGNDLPASTSEFIGRTAEMARLNSLLSGAIRLVTLVGPGGIGKSRLAAECLREAWRVRSGGWVRLAEAETGIGSILPAVAQAVLPAPVAAEVTWDIVGEALSAGTRPILVLDDCEHVLEAVCRCVLELSETAPELTILVTSREPVGWSDEYLVRVPPLRHAEALELFRQRAAFVGRPLPAAVEESGTARRICCHLDHNPLFISFAGARLLHRPPAAVLGELTGDRADRRLRWRRVTHGLRETRHGGIAEVVGRSVELCQDDERLLLERLSVFAAGFEAEPPELARNGIDLGAAIAICADEALPADRIEPLLDRLVDRSLLGMHIAPSSVRYHLSESVRVFAAQRLARDARATAESTSRHRRYYFDRAAEIPGVLWGPEQPAWRDWSYRMWDNVRGAIDAALSDQAAAPREARHIAELLACWIPGGRSDPVLVLAERLPAAGDTGHPAAPSQAEALASIARLVLWRGDYDRARKLLSAATRLIVPTAPWWAYGPEHDLGLPAALEWAWGSELLLVSADPRAIVVLERAAAKYRAADASRCASACEQLLLLARAWLLTPAAAVRHANDQLSAAIDDGRPEIVSWAELAAAVALARAGRASEALEITGELLVHPRLPDDTWMARWAMVARIIALRHGISGAGGYSARRARLTAAAEAARLVGALSVLPHPECLRIERIPLVVAQTEPCFAAASQVLGVTAAHEAGRRGERLHREFADGVVGHRDSFIERLLDGPVEAAEETSRWETLTRAEREVAVFAAAGWTNGAIAAQRRCSVRTVDAQVAAIRQKLMIASRAEIVRHLPGDMADLAEEMRQRPPRGSAHE